MFQWGNEYKDFNIPFFRNAWKSNLTKADWTPEITTHIKKLQVSNFNEKILIESLHKKVKNINLILSIMFLLFLTNHRMWSFFQKRKRNMFLHTFANWIGGN